MLADLSKSVLQWTIRPARDAIGASAASCYRHTRLERQMYVSMLVLAARGLASYGCLVGVPGCPRFLRCPIGSPLWGFPTDSGESNHPTGQAENVRYPSDQ